MATMRGADDRLASSVGACQGWDAIERAWPELLMHDGYELYPPVDEQAISAASAELGHTFPADLAELYRTSNGVFDKPGQWFVIWTLDILVEQNLLGCAGRLHPRELLLFGDAGSEDSFGIYHDDGGEVVCWHPTDGLIRWHRACGTFRGAGL